MTGEWKHQVRIYFEEADAEIARKDPENPRFQQIAPILQKHRAALRNQLQAFEDYVGEAEREGVDAYPLYKWTRLTIEDPEKRAKHLRAFAVALAGETVYAKPLADALAADLEPLVGKGLITRLSRHDTNPENNIRPPAHLT